MADGPYGAREIFVDLTSAGARVIRDPANLGLFVEIRAVRIDGTTSGAGPGDITLRSDTASGNIIFKALGPAATSFDGSLIPLKIRCQGLYMDALTNAWAAGSFMIIYTV